MLDVPLSITTVPPVEGKARPYEDEFDPGGLLRYRYRGTDPAHRDNAGLRRAMQEQIRLWFTFMASSRVALLGVLAGVHVGDDPHALTFTVAVDDKQFATLAPERLPETPEVDIRRR